MAWAWGEDWTGQWGPDPEGTSYVAPRAMGSLETPPDMMKDTEAEA